MTQDRLTRKDLCRKAGTEDRAFLRSVIRRDRRARLSRKLNRRRGILKTRRFGYDGKGQAKVASADEAAKAFESFKGAPAILEGFVDFSFEASVVAARGADGSFAAYDPPENEHENHILRRSTVPSRLTRGAGATKPRRSPRRSPTRWTMSACWRWSCSWARTARCWSTRSRPGSTIPATGPSRPATARSSNSISAPWRAGRWAIPPAMPMR